MKTSKDGMYSVEDGKAVPIRANDMEWLLRYGDEKEIIKHRLYIAHIVNLYVNGQRQNN